MLEWSFNSIEPLQSLKEELLVTSQGADEEYNKVEIYINCPCILDEYIDIIKKRIPKINKGLHGMVGEYYVTSYFDGSFLAVTSCIMGVTGVWIDAEYFKAEKRLFLISVLRNHMNRHWIYRGYIVLHAGALHDCDTGKGMIVCGASQSGKTTFIMEAIKTGRYLMVGEDRIVVDVKTKSAIGSRVVHLKADRFEHYAGLVSKFSIINGGKEVKFSGLIKDKYLCGKTQADICIFLENKANEDSSYINTIDGICEKEKLLKLTQEGIYLENEKEAFNNAVEFLRKITCYRLGRCHSDINFEVYEREFKKSVR